MGTMDSLIRLAAEARALAAEEQAQKLEADLVEASATIQAALGDLWQELEPYVAGRHYTHNRYGTLQQVAYQVAAPEMARFWVKWGTRGVTLATSEDGYGQEAAAAAKDEVAEFLLKRWEAWVEQQAEARKEQLNKLQHVLSYYGNETPEEAERALAGLIALEPDREAAWRKLYAGWQAGYHRALEQEEQQRRWQENLEAQKVAYREAYRTHYAAYRAATARNLERAQALQAELDVPFHAWELRYGVVASDEDGGQFVEVHTALVLDEAADRAGDRRAINNHTGRLETRHFYHPVSRSEMILTRPTAHSIGGNLVAASVTVDGVGEYMRLYFRPTLAADTVTALLAERLGALPEEPEFGNLLRSYEIDDIRSAVRREFAGEMEESF